jgi:hypothetical protein
MRAGDAKWEEAQIPEPLTMLEPWSDPDTLILFFSSDAQECSNPVLVTRCNDEGKFWQYVVGIPPELARPGPIDLTEPRLNHYMLTANNIESPACTGTGSAGSAGWGTVELVSQEGAAVSVTAYRSAGRRTRNSTRCP